MSQEKKSSIFDDFGNSMLLHIYSMTGDIPEDIDLIEDDHNHTVLPSKTNHLTEEIYVDYRYDPLDILDF